jgi:hypothetical protein
LAYDLDTLVWCIVIILPLFILLFLLALDLVAQDLVLQQVGLRDRLLVLLFPLLVFPLFLQFLLSFLLLVVDEIVTLLLRPIIKLLL